MPTLRHRNQTCRSWTCCAPLLAGTLIRRLSSWSPLNRLFLPYFWDNFALFLPPYFCLRYTYRRLLQIAVALLHSGMEQPPQVVQSLRTRAARISSYAASIVPRMRTSVLKELMARYGLPECDWCQRKQDYLINMIPTLRTRLPVTLNAETLEVVPLEDPYKSHATMLAQVRHCRCCCLVLACRRCESSWHALLPLLFSIVTQCKPTT